MAAEGPAEGSELAAGARISWDGAYPRLSPNSTSGSSAVLSMRADLQTLDEQI